MSFEGLFFTDLGGGSGEDIKKDDRIEDGAKKDDGAGNEVLEKEIVDEEGKTPAKQRKKLCQAVDSKTGCNGSS